MLDVILDTLIDTVKLLPFLFLTYLAMEWLEHRTEEKTQALVQKAGHLGPLFGGLLGVVPQCGFSTASSTLYAGRVITLGTLLAIYLSTSDEMLPIFLSSPDAEGLMIVKILLVKVCYAVAAGFAVDGIRHFLIQKGILHRRHILPATADPKELELEPGAEHIKDLCEQEQCNCERGILASALLHTLQIAVFILIINFVLNMVFFFAGEEFLQGSVLNHAFLGPILGGLVGLIPNCAASVAITQLYLSGALSGSAMIAGLMVGAGVGILVLFRANHDWRENLIITGLLYLLGVLGGFCLGFLF